MNRGGISAGEGEPFAPPPSPGAHQPTRDSPLASCEEGTCSGATKLRLSSECQRVFGEQGRGVPGSLWGQTRTNVNRAAGSQQLLSPHCVDSIKIPPPTWGWGWDPGGHKCCVKERGGDNKFGAFQSPESVTLRVLPGWGLIFMLIEFIWERRKGTNYHW